MTPLFTDAEIDQMTDSSVASLLEFGRIPPNMADFFREHIRKQMVELFKSQERKIEARVRAHFWTATTDSHTLGMILSYESRSSEFWPHV